MYTILDIIQHSCGLHEIRRADYVPGVVVFDAGKEVIRIEAFMKSFHFQSVLDYVSSGAYKEQPNLQRFIRGRADALRERGVAVDIWK